MRALVCHAFGRPDDLRIDTRPDPQPRAGEARVRFACAALNFPDLLIIHGKYEWKPELPYVPCVEGAGVVDAVGPGAGGVRVGDRVIVAAGHTFAEQVVAPVDKLLPMPANMSFEQAGGFAVTYATTYHAFKQRARLKAGETLLVLGAAGGVGVTAIELGKLMGARVIAAASSPEKLAYCRELGADATIDYSIEPLKDRVRALTDGHGVDVIYDPVGGAHSEAAFRGIAWGGRHLVIGFAAGEIPRARRLVGRLGRTLPRGGARQCRRTARSGRDRAAEPARRRTHALDDYVAACRSLAERRARGKVLLKIGGSA